MDRSLRLVLAAGLLAACAACASNERRATTDAAPDNEARRRAARLLDAGAFDEAVAALEPLLRQAPHDEEAWVMLGDAHRGRKDLTQGVKSYEEAIRLNYGDYHPHLKLGVLLMENGKTGRALTEFEIAVKFGRDDPLTHYNYGLALHELGRRPEALEQWRTAREMDPSRADFVEAVGIGLAGVDDRTAVECFRHAEELGRTGASFYNNYALALEHTGDDAQATRYFERAVQSAREGGGGEEYRRNLALHHLRMGRNQDAARGFDDLVTRFGGKWSYLVYLARARVALGRHEEAVAALEPFASELEAGELDRTSGRIDRVPPTVAEALDVLGMAWRGRGDRKRALDYLRRAVGLEPTDPAHLNNYGVVLAESGMLADARAQWRRVLEIDPENATAKANLAAFGP